MDINTIILKLNIIVNETKYRRKFVLFVQGMVVFFKLHLFTLEDLDVRRVGRSGLLSNKKIRQKPLSRFLLRSG